MGSLRLMKVPISKHKRDDTYEEITKGALPSLNTNALDIYT